MQLVFIQIDPLTCDDIRLLGEAFTTVSDDEINSVEAAEFTECLSDIGELDGWNATQKELLLVKTLAVSWVFVTLYYTNVKV